MAKVIASDAVSYAVSRQLLLLYCGFLIFWVLQIIAEVTRGIFPISILNELLPMTVSISSFAVLLITIVAIGYKVLTDARVLS
ncbi:hypothetical protein BRD08_08910 [Halobacteriales archaeon SW_10_66_29]|nr:MAG: hypothetical protein BRD08_08910 [Halobacteriales archaeon SW_10_66_29]